MLHIQLMWADWMKQGLHGSRIYDGMPMDRWRLIVDEPYDPRQNMAIDEALLLGVAQGAMPVIRFYQWQPPGLTLGYFQKSQEIDHHACQSAGIPVIRRITGGRAILHVDEVTYSVIIPEDWPHLPKRITQAYKLIAEGLVQGLQGLGLPVVLSPIPHKRVLGATAACFDAPCWYEVMALGRKLVGSAQTRRHGTMLQHGSIPLKPQGNQLFQLLSYSEQTARQEALEHFNQRAICVGDLVENITFSQVWPQVAQGLENRLKVQLFHGELSIQERKTAQILFETKYDNDSWNKKGHKGQKWDQGV